MSVLNIPASAGFFMSEIGRVMENYAHISARVLNQPLMLDPTYASVFFSALAGRLGIASLNDGAGEIMLGERMRVSAASYSGNREARSYEVVNGVAVLPIEGTLVHKFGYMQPTSGMTGYDGILQRAAEAFTDSEVKGVLLDMNTPGGEVAGCFDTARALRTLADESGKPLWSLSCDRACSAGMALASVADRRLVTSTGVFGSVGVVIAHTSYEKQKKVTR